MSEKKTLLARLPKGWDKTLAQEYQTGASDYEVMAKLRITPALFKTLYAEPETGVFKELVDFGRIMAKAWWYRQFRENLQTRGFQGNMLYNYMKNQYGWSDKTTTTTKEDADLSTEELDARITEIVAKFKKVNRI